MTHLRTLLAAQILGAAALLIIPAAAQTAPASATPPPADQKILIEEPKHADASKDEPLQLEKVEVTGSRIRTLVGEQPVNPVFTLTQVELEQRGVSRLADLRWAIPQLGATTGFNDNLQNGGPSRAQQVSTSFNLRGLGGNSTLVLIDGHRVPHTGQSAPGGAGGREDFNIDGIPVSAIDRIEVLPQGASAIYGTEAIAGVVNIILKKNYTGTELQVSYDNTFDTDVGQTTVSLTSGYRKGKLSAFLTLSQTDQNGLASRDRWFTHVNTSPQYSPYGGSGTLATGYYASSSTTLLPGLTVAKVGIPAGANGRFTAAQAAAAPLGDVYNFTDYATQIDPSRSRSVVFKADYNYTDWLQPYAQARWSEFNNHYTGTPSTLTTQLPASYPGNPFGVPVYLSKVFYDLPVPTVDSYQINSGLTLGARGKLPHGWNYDASFDWARNTTKDTTANSGFDFSKLSAGVNAATPVILTYDSSTAGTDPNAAGVMLGLLQNSKHKDVTDVYQYDVTADGPVWAGWAGDVQLAVGAEAREEKSTFSVTPAVSYLLSSPFTRRINAGFAEVSVPLLSDRQHLAFVHQFTVGGAVRYENFSDLGNHHTPSGNVLFQPVKWLTLRASHTTGYKAPKLYDLLAPNYTTTTTITASRNVKDTHHNNAPVVGTYALTSGGQPHLNPETSVSRDFGVVLDVPGKWFKGLSFSVDFWDLDYTDKVGGPSYQVLIDYFPTRVTRDPTTDVITGFDTSNINLSSVTTKGVDYRMTYQHAFGFGTLMFDSTLTDPGVQWTTATPGSAPSSTYGYQPKRFSGSLFWSHGPWTAGVSTNYQAQYLIYGPGSPQYAKHPTIEWNPQVTYDFGHTARFAPGSLPDRVIGGTKLSVTVVNVFNNEPNPDDLARTNYAMDPRLRRYILTLTKKF